DVALLGLAVGRGHPALVVEDLLDLVVVDEDLAVFEREAVAVERRVGVRDHRHAGVGVGHFLVDGGLLGGGEVLVRGLGVRPPLPLLLAELLKLQDHALGMTARRRPISGLARKVAARASLCSSSQSAYTRRGVSSSGFAMMSRRKVTGGS